MSRHPSRHVTRLLLASLLAGCSNSSPPIADKPAVEQPAAPKTPSTPTASAPAASELPPLEEGFQRLALVDCDVFPADAANWKEEGALLVTTGKPKSYLKTKTPFGDFTLRYDYRFPSPPKDPAKAPLANTGVLLFITGEDAIWPKALEIQGKHAEIGSIRPNGGAAEVAVHEVDGIRQSATHAVGEWNAIEVVARGGALTVRINGQKLLESEAGELKSGHIGFQAEGHAVEFRNVRIQTAPAPTTAPAAQ